MRVRRCLFEPPPPASSGGSLACPPACRSISSPRIAIAFPVSGPVKPDPDPSPIISFHRIHHHPRCSGDLALYPYPQSLSYSASSACDQSLPMLAYRFPDPSPITTNSLKAHQIDSSASKPNRHTMYLSNARYCLLSGLIKPDPDMWHLLRADAHGDQDRSRKDSHPSQAFLCFFHHRNNVSLKRDSALSIFTKIRPNFDHL